MEKRKRGRPKKEKPVEVKLDGAEVLKVVKEELAKTIAEEVEKHLPKPEPERQSITGERAKQLLGRREGIVVMTPNASEEFDHQSKQNSPKVDNPNIFRPGKPTYDGPNNFNAGSRY